MNSRHAAALVLVGWYLMMPYGGNSQSDWERSIRAPISEWQHFKSFDRAADCETENQNMKNQVTKSKERPIPITVRPLMFGECIATDDPRLKEK